MQVFDWEILLASHEVGVAVIGTALLCYAGVFVGVWASMRFVRMCGEEEDRDE